MSEDDGERNILLCCSSGLTTAMFAEKYEIGNLVDSDRIKNERGERYHLLGNIPHLSKFI